MLRGGGIHTANATRGRPLPARFPARRARRSSSFPLARGVESKLPMNKRQLIDGIRQLNQTAQPEFLAQFDDEALAQYLRHLQTAQEKRLKVAGWVKSIPKPRFRLVS
jgi:hypothetical protein